MSENKNNTRFRKYAYWILLFLAIAALAIVLVLTAQKSSEKNVAENEALPQQESFVSAEPITFLNPLLSCDVLKGYSNSALQYNKTLKQWEAHKAIDFAAEEGTDVYAVMDGKITEVSYNYLMGNVVKLDCGNGLVFVYKSLAGDVPVSVGQNVKKGDVIGKVGQTAKSEASDGPHLHFEAWLNDKNVDPNEYLDLEQK
ncbi:MAG: M23 family metallopeptidase [Clostridia bacterium]|nr:M23 family metallopeptidase [Clostridia bacterium]